LSLYRASVPRTLVLVVALFSTGASTGALARQFGAADPQCEDHPTAQALRRLMRALGRLIAEWTGGRHQIRISHSQQLEEKESIDQTRVGAIDINRTNVALIGNLVPSMNVPAMPFLFHSIENQRTMLDRPTVKARLAADRTHAQCGVTGT
jgi:TRAP-type C4-dicarboxylate transport system substrate-binding protein